jgi:hypothetical protein
MIPEGQSAIDRRHARESTGSQTAKGKVRTCADALKHGIGAVGFPLDELLLCAIESRRAETAPVSVEKLTANACAPNEAVSAAESSEVYEMSDACVDLSDRNRARLLVDPPAVPVVAAEPELAPAEELTSAISISKEGLSPAETLETGLRAKRTQRGRCRDGSHEKSKDCDAVPGQDRAGSARESRPCCGARRRGDRAGYCNPFSSLIV